MSLEEERGCRCVTKHVPLPFVYYSVLLGDGTTVTLCPTAKDNLENFRKVASNYGGNPPGSVRKHYSEYIQTLAKESV
jgi:hypothetical protein